jgi:hypothetical protein
LDGFQIAVLDKANSRSIDLALLLPWLQWCRFFHLETVRELACGCLD